MNELELRDIHLPDASLWWPPAPGWWLVLLTLLAVAVAIPRLRRWLRHKPLSRLSMIELQRIRRDYDDEGDVKATVNEIACLLRRTLISYKGRSAHAASAGEAWLDELQRLTPHQDFDDEQLHLLARNRYQPEYECDIEALLAACERWIRSLPRRPAHVPD